MSDDIKKFRKLLKEYAEGRRFDEETVITLKKSIEFRFSGWSFEAISDHFGLTRSRINNLEKAFIKSLSKNEVKQYNELVVEGKKNRRTI